MFLNESGSWPLAGDQWHKPFFALTIATTGKRDVLGNPLAKLSGFQFGIST
jgi:hypothetical protein